MMRNIHFSVKKAPAEVPRSRLGGRSGHTGIDGALAEEAIVLLPRPRTHVAGLGRIPKQHRSRERLARILESGRHLIGESDTLSVNMSAVSRRAGIPIASLYQYFPTKAALIAQLFKHRLEQHRALARARLAAVRTPAQYARVVYELHMRFYRDNRRDAFLREIWGGAQASRATREIHRRDNEFYVRLWNAVARRAGSRLAAETLRLRATAINEMWDGAIRLAITLPEAEGRALMHESMMIGMRALGMRVEVVTSRLVR